MLDAQLRQNEREIEPPRYTRQRLLHPLLLPNSFLDANAMTKAREKRQEKVVMMMCNYKDLRQGLTLNTELRNRDEKR
jgi:hypothetical protein